MQRRLLDVGGRGEVGPTRGLGVGGAPVAVNFSKGKGSKKKGGAPASVGHMYAFGNTEEAYRRQGSRVV